jgi:uncharacterized membrane protein
MQLQSRYNPLMANISWFVRKLLRLVIIYSVLTLICAAVYTLFRDSLSRTQLYFVSVGICLAVLLLLMATKRIMKSKPHWYGRDVE